MTRQALLIGDPETPAGWCNLWGITLIGEIPVKGPATAADYAGVPEDLSDWPGRNHPRLGEWLHQEYGSTGCACADPMFGAGALWSRVGCTGLEVAELERLNRQDARTWRPTSKRELVMFSPPFLQNHDSGQSEHQRQLVEAKGLHAIQAFGSSVGNLGRMQPREFFIAMRQVYARVLSYTTSEGHMVVILRDMIRNGQSLDHVGRHIGQMRFARWGIVGAWFRDLERPTGFQQMKLARDPETPWTRYEWAIVARKG
jgi:hypothetical protein